MVRRACPCADRGLEHFVKLNPLIRLAPLTRTVSAPGCKIHLNAQTSPLFHTLCYSLAFYAILCCRSQYSELHLMQRLRGSVQILSTAKDICIKPILSSFFGFNCTSFHLKLLQVSVNCWCASWCCLWCCFNLQPLQRASHSCCCCLVMFSSPSAPHPLLLLAPLLLLICLPQLCNVFVFCYPQPSAELRSRRAVRHRLRGGHR